MDAGSPAGWEFGHFGNRAGRHGNANAGARSEEGEEETEAGPAGGEGEDHVAMDTEEENKHQQDGFHQQINGNSGNTATYWFRERMHTSRNEGTEKNGGQVT